MSERSEYPAGVPCWVENLTDDVERTRRFYGALFGWEWSEPGPMAGDDALPYYVARVGGSDVAGVAPAPPDVAPAWMTHVRVASVEGTARSAEDAGGTVLAGPMDVHPAGRLVVIADPAGAVLCGFEPGVRQGAQRVNEPSAWAMSALSTPEPERCAAFYRDVFGWETEAFGPFTLFRLPGYVGGEPSQPVPRDVVAAMAPAGADEPAAWNVDFWIADADRAVAAAKAQGGSVISPLQDAPPFRRAVIADPAGAALSVSQLVLAP